MIRTDLYPMGRKHCSMCGRWRHLYEFGRSGVYLHAYCKTCDRVNARIRIGLKKRGKPYKARQLDVCKKGHRFTPDNTYISPGGEWRACRICRRAGQRRWLRNRSPEQIEARREYVRFYEHAQRRAAGAKEIKRTAKTPQDHAERLMLRAEPFGEWLRENPPVEGSWSEWARSHDVDESQIRRIREGQQELVHIDTVDKVLTAAGVFLFEVYPELYEFEDEAVSA